MTGMLTYIPEAVCISWQMELGFSNFVLGEVFGIRRKSLVNFRILEQR